MDFVENLNYKNEKNKSSYSMEKKHVTFRVINNLSHLHTKNSENTYQ